MDCVPTCWPESPRTVCVECRSVEDKAKMLLDDILERLPEGFDMLEIADKLQGEERTPFTNVFLQEIERMNVLLVVMKESLFSLDLGLKGDLTISEVTTQIWAAKHR